jgi:hypothetical protein
MLLQAVHLTLLVVVLCVIVGGHLLGILAVLTNNLVKLALPDHPQVFAILFPIQFTVAIFIRRVEATWGRRGQCATEANAKGLPIQ